jgi:hypothetical protein
MVSLLIGGRAMMRNDRDSDEESSEKLVDALDAAVEHLVAYGSLATQASLEHSLGRAVDPPELVSISGWRRSWTSVYVDSGWAALDEAGRLYQPRLWHYLDLEAASESRLRAAVYRLRAEDLARLDRREIGYERLVLGGAGAGRRLWAYRSLAAFRAPLPEEPRQGAIARSYLELVLRGHRELGLDPQRLGDLIPPAALVVDDRPIPALRQRGDGCSPDAAG